MLIAEIRLQAGYFYFTPICVRVFQGYGRKKARKKIIFTGFILRGLF